MSAGHGASPWFLLIFLASVTLTVRPCLYCTILLAALFTTTCFWQPVPTEVLLQGHYDLINSTSPTHLLEDVNLQPLVDLVTQYHNANSSAASESVPDVTPTSTAPTRPLTTLLPRCWCDIPFSFFAHGVGKDYPGGAATTTPSQRAASHRRNRGMFEPFDQKAWETTSLVRHAREAVREQKGEEATDETEVTTNDALNTTQAAISVAEAIYGSVNDLDDTVNLLQLVWRAVFRPLRARLPSFIPSQPIADREEDIVPTKDVPKSPIETSTVIPEMRNPPATPPAAGSSLPPLPSTQPQDLDYSLVSLAWTFVPLKRIWPPIWFRTVAALQRQYDLRPYGLGVTLDFGWTGQS
ncbi:hypothetical protein FRB96_006204 [Tulasnella sp. 330]|nr:hypothetical protein FRB96_006204 [Tulasnella sp. 330]